MRPYYQSADGAITVYHARWESALAAGLIPVREVALVHADPPYGTRMKSLGNKGGNVGVKRKTTTGGGMRVREFAPVLGDDRQMPSLGLTNQLPAALPQISYREGFHEGSRMFPKLIAQ